MDSGLKTDETNDRKMTLQEQEQFLMEALNWMSIEEIEENKRITEAEEDVDRQFVLFYIAFRKAEMLKKGKNPLDVKEVNAYDEMILHPENEELRIDLYNYIGESLVELFSKET